MANRDRSRETDDAREAIRGMLSELVTDLSPEILSIERSLGVRDLIDVDDIPVTELDDDPTVNPPASSQPRSQPQPRSPLEFRRATSSRQPDFVQRRPTTQMIAGNQIAFFWIDSRREISNPDAPGVIPNPTFGWFLCRSPYSKEMVEEIKLAIPWSAEGVSPQRQFIKPLKVWAVRPRFSEALVNIVSKYFTVRELEQDPWARASESSDRARDMMSNLNKTRENVIEAGKAESVELPQFRKRKVEV